MYGGKNETVHTGFRHKSNCSINDKYYIAIYYMEQNKLFEL